MDEFDMDVSDIAPAPPADAGRVPETARSGLAADLSGAKPAPIAAPARRQTRALRVAGTLALLLLALAIPLASLPPTQRAISALLHPPTATATPLFPPGALPVGYFNSVPWGVLRIDGHVGVHLSGMWRNEGQELFPPVLTLARGHHALAYDAPPFPSLRCTISAPAAAQDTCPIIGNASRAIDLRATPDRLSLPLQTSLIAAVQAALDGAGSAESTTTIPVAIGEHYLGATGQPTMATVPLGASLQIQLNTDPGQPLPMGVGAVDPIFAACVTVCSDTGAVVLQASTAWPVLAHVAVTYRYRSADGRQVVLDHAPAAMPAQRDHQFVQFGVNWASGRWTIQRADPMPLDTQLIRGIAIQMLDGAVFSHDVTYRQEFNWRTSVAVPPAAGCVVIGDPPPPGQTPTLPTLPLLLDHFGVLLAVNASARQLFPELPVASASEQIFAQSLAPIG